MKTLISKLIVKLAALAGINLLGLAYRSRGINTHFDISVNGEALVLDHILREWKKTGAEPTILDVGANIGDFSTRIARDYPEAVIHAFEPNPVTFEQLQKNLGDSQCQLHNLGMGSAHSTMTIYVDPANRSTALASLYPEVMKDIHQSDTAEEVPVQIGVLDDFCKEQGLGNIDLLKIDTEGHEFEVLRGARQLLTEQKIALIQFEFNSMNIISRVFLKDFYDLLTDYDFYRIHPKGLFPLGKYSHHYEIFEIQNMLAVHKEAALADSLRKLRI